MALTIRITPGRVLAVGDIITEDILNDLANPTVELEGSVSTTTIADNSITLAKLIVGILTADAAGRSRMADEFVTAAKLSATLDLTGKTISGNPSLTLTGVVNLAGATVTLPAGQSYQVATATSATYTNVTNNIPFDDTIPQQGGSEGTEILTVAITPRFSTSKLVIHAVAYCEMTGAGANLALALFQDATANAIAVAADSNAGALQPVELDHAQTAGTTSAITFRLRVGADTGNVEVNGFGGARKYGGVMKTFISVTEVAA